MPFHVEVSSSLNDARVFNLDETELSEILDRWVAGLPLEFGAHRWEPRESRLTILEGREIDSPETAEGDSWADALRAAEDVTRPMLEAAEARAPSQTAIVVEADSLQAAINGLRAGRPQQPIEWQAAVEMISQRNPNLTAVILVVKR